MLLYTLAFVGVSFLIGVVVAFLWFIFDELKGRNVLPFPPSEPDPIERLKEDLRRRVAEYRRGEE
jgi:hypothetical protein